ncbi:tRNA A64-2'-O-ribosylphosphate transferase [Candida viswanathii]|uniref:tRNA A64-2'-O-ribosylphosphate transferase n=1 Tax=Candida viswanathii TaxID=5486 RepID=A0A367XXV6_9ASCO|nr:tRNA A64-2'-O-ribosylphosphate transferase [Candida viswanathii]
MTYSQPIFNANNDINDICKDLKKSLLSLKNRLQSILYDYRFVQAVHQSLEYPLVANERCGLWYVPPRERQDTCYFKSTDGHTNVWTFSLRRLNLHLVLVIASAGGVTIVDSTRRGKLMPDALLKTIPIWCAVVNTVLYSDGDWLRTPRSMVSENEHNSIKKLIPSFVEEVKRMRLFDGCERLEKPLVPSWYYPSCKAQTIDSTVYNVCCVSASTKVDVHMQVRVGNGVSFDYVQGSADDHELWAPPHLTPDVFWEICHGGYITMGDSQLEDTINSYKPPGSTLETFTLRDTGITIGKIESDALFSQLATPTAIVFHEQHTIADIPEGKSILHYKISSNKKGANALRTVLPELPLDLPCTILCDSGRDISVGIALILLCLHFDLDWKRTTSPPKVTKTLIKQHLGKISQLCKANPSRSTLQSVNTFLFSL